MTFIPYIIHISIHISSVEPALRWFPEVPEQARVIKRGEAWRVLAQRYIDNAVATVHNKIAKVFHVLKWTSRELDRTIAALLEEGSIQEVQIKGMEQLQLVPIALLDCTL